jgi:hypothetical protein
MATGLAWNMSNPLKPYALFDPNAVRDIPCSWAAWFTDINDTYLSHTVTAEAPFECTNSAEDLQVITARVKVANGGTPVPGKKYKVTWHVRSVGGQEDDQTLYLKVVEK